MKGKSLIFLLAVSEFYTRNFGHIFPLLLPLMLPSSTHHFSYPFIFKSQMSPICAGRIVTDLPVTIFVKKSHHLPVFPQSGNLHTRMLSGLIFCESCAENYSCCGFAHDLVMSRRYVSFGYHLTFWFLQLFCSLFLNSP